MKLRLTFCKPQFRYLILPVKNRAIRNNDLIPSEHTIYITSSGSMWSNIDRREQEKLFGSVSNEKY